MLAFEQTLMRFAESIAARYFPAASGRLEGPDHQWACVIYDIRHVTTYSYETPVASSTLTLRVTPRDDGGQHCLAHAVLISPEPRSVIVEHDFFGNTVSIALIETSLVDLSIEARARVDVSRPRVRPLAAALT